jgi:trans-aconitate methyltransferase
MVRTETVGWDPALYAANAAFVPALGNVVLKWLGARAGERVLDLGCGDGSLTARIVESGAVVDGVDADAAMVAAARGRGLSATVCDARALTAEAEYDAVFSNATLHWIRPPETVIAGVARALKRGGRFVGEFGGHGNIAAIRAGLSATLVAHGLAEIGKTEWQYYPAADDYAALLEDGGFRVERCEIVARPTPLPGSLGDWLRTFRGGFLDAAGVSAGAQETVIAETEARLRPILCDDRGRWTADYVRLRFSAFLPE